MCFLSLAVYRVISVPAGIARRALGDSLIVCLIACVEDIIKGGKISRGEKNPDIKPG